MPDFRGYCSTRSGGAGRGRERGPEQQPTPANEGPTLLDRSTPSVSATAAPQAPPQTRENGEETGQIRRRPAASDAAPPTVASRGRPASVAHLRRPPAGRKRKRGGRERRAGWKREKEESGWRREKKKEKKKKKEKERKGEKGEKGKEIRKFPWASVLRKIRDKSSVSRFNFGI